MALPDKFAALADGPTDSGTPTVQPKTYMLTRHQTERIIRAARAIVPDMRAMELPAGYTMVRSTLIADLVAALKGVNIDV